MFYYNVKCIRHISAVRTVHAPEGHCWLLYNLFSMQSSFTVKPNTFVKHIADREERKKVSITPIHWTFPNLRTHIPTLYSSTSYISFSLLPFPLSPPLSSPSFPCLPCVLPLIFSPFSSLITSPAPSTRWTRSKLPMSLKNFWRPSPMRSQAQRHLCEEAPSTQKPKVLRPTVIALLEQLSVVLCRHIVR